MIDLTRARNGFRVGNRRPVAIEGQTYGLVAVLDRIEPDVRGDGIPARYNCRCIRCGSIFAAKGSDVVHACRRSLRTLPQASGDRIVTSRGEEKVSALAKAIQTILETGESKRGVVDKFAAALHQLGLTKEAELIFAAASTLWDQPSDVEQIAAWFEKQATKERELLDSNRLQQPRLAEERWIASAQDVRAGVWKKTL